MSAGGGLSGGWWSFVLGGEDREFGPSVGSEFGGETLDVGSYCWYRYGEADGYFGVG